MPRRGWCQDRAGRAVRPPAASGGFVGAGIDCGLRAIDGGPPTLPPLSAHARVRLSGGASEMRQGSLPPPCPRGRAGVGAGISILLAIGLTLCMASPALAQATDQQMTVLHLSQ